MANFDCSGLGILCSERANWAQIMQYFRESHCDLYTTKYRRLKGTSYESGGLYALGSRLAICSWTTTESSSDAKRVSTRPGAVALA